MAEFLPLAAAGALLLKAVDMLKYLMNQDKRWVTQLVVWVAGIGLTFLLAESTFGPSIEIANHSLASLNGAARILAGLSLASLTSVTVDFKKAFDNSDSAATPPLVK